MSDDHVELADIWPDAYQPDWQLLEGSRGHYEFGKASFELLKEAAIITHLAASILPTDGLARDEAIVTALLLKASKLTKALIAVTSQLGSDRQLALFRELIEALATLHYLLGDDGSGIRFTQYADDSLVVEREFLKTITQNVRARGTAAWPIEEGMKRSIEQTATAAGVSDVSALPSRTRIGWPRAEALVEELGPNIYLAYRGGSSVLHSKWHDLISHHLRRQDNGRFELRFDDVAIRPEPVYATGLLLVDQCRNYLSTLMPGAIERFGARLDDLESRVLRVMQLHGEWLDGDEDGAT